MITSHKIRLARENWLKASKELKFKIVTPILLEINGITKNAFAYLPEYGSPNGVIIELIAPPDYQTDNYIEKWARLKNCFYSFINIQDALVYNQEYFRELLEDWIKYIKD